MQIKTTRFGQIAIEPDDVLQFPAGLFGLEDCRWWVLLADAANDAVGWMQSTTRPEIALAVVSPRRFVPSYQVRVSSSELVPLGLECLSDAKVLVIVSRNEKGMTLNLKAPLVINLRYKKGKQVVTSGDQPLQFQLSETPAPSRMTA
jgi:flagellar assembly factor FliW